MSGERGAEIELRVKLRRRDPAVREIDSRAREIDQRVREQLAEDKKPLY